MMVEDSFQSKLLVFACFFSFSTLKVLALSSRVVVIGKIIIDEYGRPGTTPTISIGGGGPQAAWGAAAALAARDTTSLDTSAEILPPRQPVTFLGAVGHDWLDDNTRELNANIGAALDTPPALIQADSPLVTPRIRLWHEEESQNIQWYAVNDSFGPLGADGLWRNRPSAQDILKAVSEEDDGKFILHSIVEAGAKAAGGGMDSDPLREAALVDRISWMGIEPVAFLDESLGTVAEADANACAKIMNSISALNIVCPDSHLASALTAIEKDPQCFHEGIHVSIREGPKGSTILQPNSSTEVKVPAAILATPDQKPVNPTGAGNAYSGAYTALLGTGSPPLEAACIANGVGAVVCEYEQLPPWEWNVIKRIQNASKQVRDRVIENNNTS